MHAMLSICAQATMQIGPHLIIDRSDYMIADELQPYATTGDLERWSAAGDIFAIDHGSATLFPRFSFAFGRRIAPWPTLKTVIAALDGYDAWHIAYCCCSSCSMLDSRTPQDFLAADPDAVLAAAHDQPMGITHG